MEQLEVFLHRLNSSYPLNIVSPALCISLANSGRRGNAKEFHITLESFISSLENIRDNLDAFPASYDESAWRMGSDRFFTDNHAKSLCGVQTRPYFETVNKFVSWANELGYTEGYFPLTKESIEKTIREINIQCLKNVLHYPLFNEHSFAGLNEEQIVDNLASKLIEERQNSRGAQYFGFKYAQYLDAHTNIITSILRKAGIDASVVAEISKGRSVFNRALEDGSVVKWYCSNNFNQPVENRETIEFVEGDLDVAQNSASFHFMPTQIIYYGVPGSGKSYEIKKKLKTVPDYNKIRTVFHPEYSNADFVGQILPEVSVNADGRSMVEYKFKPGPFTEIIRRAYLNPDEEFHLVIEEINRGNSAAIFGDMFQLLDRLDVDENPDEVSSENIYGKGWSSYGVDNQDVNAYIRNQVVISQEKPDHCSKTVGCAGDSNPKLYKTVDIISEKECVTWRKRQENGFTTENKHLHFSANTAIRLPPNLSIYATMNTSDQNVFTLDNAFQRRWEMKQISNDLAHDDPAADTTKQYDEIIGNTNVKWGVFRDEINKIIMQSAEENGLSSMEDKRLGGWFITPKKELNASEGETPKITNEAFAEKVLKYLWDDAFKFDRSKHFGDIKTLEDLTKKFKTDGFKIFEDDSIKKLQQEIASPSARNDESVDTSVNNPTQNGGNG
ncbi:AAA family ATPase [Fibrobacter succinogenes]|uniref:AAA family ATPase n=1 Tax=Fibrobacter succinogenes TaxID=833 RepID=UPI0015687FA6|nr:AAA family ATPase [Fibrobacter succinogenes]